MLVLAVTALLALLALSLAFTVTLDTFAARSALDHALADGQVEGALALGAAAALDGIDAPLPDSLGPWPESGIDIDVKAWQDDSGAIWLRAQARSGRTTVRRVLVVAGDAGGAVAVLDWQ